MAIRHSQLNKAWLKQLAATILAIWLSGASCLLCCGPTEKSPTETESCSTSLPANNSDAELCHEDDCCAETSGNDQSSSNEPCQNECCILDAPASELPGNFKLNHFLAITPPTVLSPSFALPVKADKLPFAQQHLPEGQTIHLRCCVFLI